MDIGIAQYNPLSNGSKKLLYAGKLQIYAKYMTKLHRFKFDIDMPSRSLTLKAINSVNAENVIDDEFLAY